MWTSFNEIGWVEIAAQSTVEFSLWNMTRVYGGGGGGGAGGRGLQPPQSWIFWGKNAYDSGKSTWRNKQKFPLLNNRGFEFEFLELLHWFHNTREL